MKPSPLNCDTLSIPIKIENDEALLCAGLISQPIFNGETPKCALKRINAYYEHLSKKLLKYAYTKLKKSAEEDYAFRKENNYPFHPYELRSDFSVTFNDGVVLSLYVDVYAFTGGAHGNTLRLADIWYSVSGFPAPISDFFPKITNIKKLMTNEAANQAAAELEDGSGMYFENYEELIKKFFSKQNIYLTSEGMALFYQQYEIAPYAQGIPVFIIPFDSEIGPYLPKCKQKI